MRYLFYSALLTLCTFTMVSSCKQKTETADPETKTEVKTEPKAITLTDFPNSDEYADAVLKSFKYDKGKYNFTLGESSYKLGEQTPDADKKMCTNSDKGQHIHLLIDDKPYSAQYTSEFDFPLEDGTHAMLAFLSRSYHESIKNGKAALAKKIEVKGGKITKQEDIKEKMIWHSRPKGAYGGKDAEKVMLDFYLTNVQLGSDFKVKAMIDETEFTIDTWKPYFIENLPMGDHTVTLTLIDKDGNKVDSPNNPAKGSFTLKADELAK